MFDFIASQYQNILFHTARIFSSVFEIVLAYILAGSFFSFRSKAKRFDFLPFVLLAGVMILLQEREIVTGVWKYAIESAALLVFLFLLYEGDLKRKLVGSMVYVVMIALSQIVSSLLLSLLIRRLDPAQTTEATRVLASSAISTLVMVGAAVLIILFGRHYRNSAAPFLLWVALLSVPAITLVTFSIYQFYVENYPENGRIIAYIYLSCLGLVFINILVFVLFGRLQHQLDLRREKDVLSSQLRQQTASINRLETLYNRTRSFRHDVKNHILVMRMLSDQGKYEELKKYLQDLSGVVDESDYVRISGVSAVDAILNEKMYEAQSNEIRTSFDVINLDKNNIEPLDLCIILSNALDNAIEANLRVEDKEQRYIKVKVHGNETFSVISVSNPVAEEPKKTGTAFLTTKKDKEAHGFGLKSIESAAAKYRGEMLAKAEDGVFTLVVRLTAPGK